MVSTSVGWLTFYASMQNVKGDVWHQKQGALHVLHLPSTKLHWSNSNALSSCRPWHLVKTQNHVCIVNRKRSCSTIDRKKAIRLKGERYKFVVIILSINLTAVSLSTLQVIKLQKGAQFLELVKIETVAQTDTRMRYRALHLCFSQRSVLIKESLFSTTSCFLLQLQRISSFRTYQITSTKHLPLLCWWPEHLYNKWYISKFFISLFS